MGPGPRGPRPKLPCPDAFIVVIVLALCSLAPVDADEVCGLQSAHKIPSAGSVKVVWGASSPITVSIARNTAIEITVTAKPGVEDPVLVMTTEASGVNLRYMQAWGRVELLPTLTNYDKFAKDSGEPWIVTFAMEEGRTYKALLCHGSSSSSAVEFEVEALSASDLYDEGLPDIVVIMIVVGSIIALCCLVGYPTQCMGKYASSDTPERLVINWKQPFLAPLYVGFFVLAFSSIAFTFIGFEDTGLPLYADMRVLNILVFAVLAGVSGHHTLILDGREQRLLVISRRCVFLSRVSRDMPFDDFNGFYYETAIAHTKNGPRVVTTPTIQGANGKPNTRLVPGCAQQQMGVVRGDMVRLNAFMRKHKPEGVVPADQDPTMATATAMAAGMLGGMSALGGVGATGRVGVGVAPQSAAGAGHMNAMQQQQLAMMMQMQAQMQAQMAAAGGGAGATAGTAMTPQQMQAQMAALQAQMAALQAQMGTGAAGARFGVGGDASGSAVPVAAPAMPAATAPSYPPADAESSTPGAAGMSGYDAHAVPGAVPTYDGAGAGAVPTYGDASAVPVGFGGAGAPIPGTYGEMPPATSGGGGGASVL